MVSDNILAQIMVDETVEKHRDLEDNMILRNLSVLHPSKWLLL